MIRKVINNNIRIHRTVDLVASIYAHTYRNVKKHKTRLHYNAI